MSIEEEQMPETAPEAPDTGRGTEAVQADTRAMTYSGGLLQFDRLGISRLQRQITRSIEREISKFGTTSRALFGRKTSHPTQDPQSHRRSASDACSKTDGPLPILR